MSTIFISYRRQDAGDIAGRIADRLKELPQVDDVFLDVESIGFGENFVDKIHNVIDRSDVCLLLIGPEWHGPREGQGPRIKEPEDFVRMEAAAVLSGDIKVIPVLLHGAEMPTQDMLPEDLSALPFRNAFPLRTAFFSQDIEVLFDDMFGENREKPKDSFGKKYGGRLLGGGLGALAGLALIIALGVVYWVIRGESPSLLFYDIAGTNANILGIAAIVVPVVTGFFVGFRKPRRKTL